MKALVNALIDGAGDRHVEAAILPKLMRALGRRHATNGSTKLTPFQRFMAKVAFSGSECWYWTGSQDAAGYGRLSATGTGEHAAHRASWVFFRGKVPACVKVLHRCDVRNCVNPDHLFLGTQAENVADMIAKGRQNFPAPRYGESNPVSRLTAAQVADIREEYARCKTPMSELANRYGVATMTICRAINRKTWVQ